MTQAVANRQKIEKKIIRRCIHNLLAAGYLLNIDNGGDDFELVEPTADYRLAFNTMYATDDDRLYVFRAGEKTPFGWIWFVYGNDGFDVISDYTCNLDHILDPINKWIDSFA